MLTLLVHYSNFHQVFKAKSLLVYILKYGYLNCLLQKNLFNRKWTKYRQQKNYSNDKLFRKKFSPFQGDTFDTFLGRLQIREAIFHENTGKTAQFKRMCVHIRKPIVS